MASPSPAKSADVKARALNIDCQDHTKIQQEQNILVTVNTRGKQRCRYGASNEGKGNEGCICKHLSKNEMDEENFRVVGE